MRLTDYEKAMLDGEHGEMRQQAMQALCDLARFYDVEEFVEVVGCHDDSTVYAGEAQVAFAEHLADNGAKFAVPTTTNATACDINLWDRQKHDVETMAATRRIEAAHVKMGAIPTWSCAPYHIGVAPSLWTAVCQCGIQCNLLLQFCHRSPHQPLRGSVGTALRHCRTRSLLRPACTGEPVCGGTCEVGG